MQLKQSIRKHFSLLKVILASVCNIKMESRLEAGALLQMGKSGCCFCASCMDCKHMAVSDNSEAIYDGGTATEFFANKFWFKSDLLLILGVPYVGFISLTTVLWASSHPVVGTILSHTGDIQAGLESDQRLVATTLTPESLHSPRQLLLVGQEPPLCSLS